MKLKNIKLVSAVIVTYNRKEMLKECLTALMKQTKPVNAIYIIDNNSNDGTPEFLMKEGIIKELPPQNLNKTWVTESNINDLTNREEIKIYYIRLNENTGGSGGFYEGIKRSFEEGYRWIWLMDDDAEPKEDALEKISKFFKEENVVAITSTVCDVNGISLTHRCFVDFKQRIFPYMLKPVPFDLYYTKKVIEIDLASFVGILLKREAIKKIGYPKKELFLHSDDWDYCFRLKRIGKILLVPESIFFHKEENKKFKKENFLMKMKQAGSYEKHWLVNHFLGKTKRRASYDKYWLVYYGVRNLIWLGKKYSPNKMLFYVWLIKAFILSLINILILYSDNKIKRMRVIISAYLDGLRETFDNEKPVRILYGKSKQRGS
jgi:GT2 family glycosyltransferase